MTSHDKLFHLNVIQFGHLKKRLMSEVVHVFEIAESNRPAQEVLVKRSYQVCLNQLTVEEGLAKQPGKNTSNSPMFLGVLY